MDMKNILNYSNQTIDHYNAGEYVVINGAPAFGLYYIAQGLIELIYKNEEGFFAKVIKSKGDTIGDENLNTHYFTFDAIALEESKLIFIDKDFIFTHPNNDRE